MSNIFVSYLLLLGAIASLYTFLGTLLSKATGIEDKGNYNTRMKQLDFSGERFKSEAEKNEKQTKKLINDITAPVIKHVMPNVHYRKDLDSLEQMLKFAKIDNYLTPAQYIALIFLGRIVGVAILLFLIALDGLVVGLIGFFGFAILPNMLIKNTVKNKREEILLGFPEFINISKSYLSSGVSFEKAVEECIMSVNKEWQELLKNFLINSQTLPRKKCLEILSSESNVFEVHEFMSLVQLNMEQGIDVKESFEGQYDKIKALQNLAMVKKIEKRKVWTILVQGPALLTIIIAFGLPTFETIMQTLSTM